MNEPLVSIIIPTYNRAYLIEETLNSILAQTHTNWECIVIDDGSTDNTQEVLKRYIKKDIRFQYHQRPKDRQKGANSCRNYGFELSKGNYVKWFDSDDIMHPAFLEKQVQLLSNQPELDFCASYSQTFSGTIENVVDSYNPEICTDDQNTLFNYIIGKIIFLTPSPLWRRQILNNKCLFDETLSNAHETDFNFSRLIEGARFKYLKEVLFFVRRGHSSIDSESFNDISSFASKFKYYQKVFLYLMTSSSILKNEEKKVLSKFILFKQLMILYDFRKISSVIYFNKELQTVIGNTIKVKLKFINLTKIFFGIFLLVFLKKGYRFFDLAELRRAKYCR